LLARQHRDPRDPAAPVSMVKDQTIGRGEPSLGGWTKPGEGAENCGAGGSRGR